MSRLLVESTRLSCALLIALACCLGSCTTNGHDPQPKAAAPKKTPASETAAPRDAAAETEPSKEAPVSGVNERIRVDLIVDKPMPITELGASVTLLSAERDHHRAPDGSRYETVRGRVLFTQGGKDSEVEFQEGSSFEQFGHPMAIFGNASDLVLSVFPPGATVRP